MPLSLALLRALVRLVVGLVVLGTVRTAHAKTDHLIVRLDPSHGGQVGTVCLVTKTAQGKKRTTLAQWADADVLQPVGDAGQLHAVREIEGRDVESAVYRGDTTSSARCSDGTCEPRIRVGEDMSRFVACYPDASVRSATVAFVELSLRQRLPFTVRSASFSKGVLSVSFEGKVEEDKLDLRSLGGSFAESPATAAGATMDFELDPRCGWHDVAMPPLTEATGLQHRMSLEVEVGGEAVDVCVDASLGEGRLRVRVPYVSDTRARRIEVEAWAPAGGISRAPPRRAVRLFGEWFEARPPDVIRTHVAALGFRWKHSCLLPQDTCPRARLVEPGLDCIGTPVQLPGARRICTYACEPAESSSNSSSFAGVRFPMTVRFQGRHPDQIWTERLSAANELLTLEIPEDRRYLKVDLSAWQRRPQRWRELPPNVFAVFTLGFSNKKSWTIDAWKQWLDARGQEEIAKVEEVAGVTGDEIESIELTLPGDQREKAWLEVPPPSDGAPYVLAPGATCADHLPYVVRGARHYGRRKAPIEEGTIAIDHPMRMVRRVGAALSAGIGALVFLEQIGGELPTAQPVGVFRFALHWRPATRRGRGLQMDFTELTWVLGRQPYFPIVEDGRNGTLRLEEEHRLYNRLLLGAGIHYAITKPLRVGIAGGGGFGFGWFKNGWAAVGRPHFVGYVAPELRWHPLPWLGVDVAVRFLLDEEIEVHRTSFVGEAISEAVELASVVPSIGLRLSI